MSVSLKIVCAWVYSSECFCSLQCLLEIMYDTYTKFIGLQRKHILLTGNPGIGKSWFLYYMMYRLIKDDKSTRIFYTRAVTGFSFFISDGKMLRCSKYDLLMQFREEKHVGTSYYFFDCVFPVLT